MYLSQTAVATWKFDKFKQQVKAANDSTVMWCVRCRAGNEVWLLKSKDFLFFEIKQRKFTFITITSLGAHHVSGRPQSQIVIKRTCISRLAFYANVTWEAIYCHSSITFIGTYHNDLWEFIRLVYILHCGFIFELFLRRSDFSESEHEKI